MSKYILEIDSIIKNFNSRNLLSDIYLKCETGEIIGILGRNGSGKTTLMKIIYGIESCENKFIKINSDVLNTNKKTFKNLSYLSQEHFIPRNFYVSKAIQLSIDDSLIQEFYEDESVLSFKNKKIHELSTGELRYLEVKILLYNNSRFCLLDEPFSALSPIMIDKISKMIRYHSKKKGILITDHNYKEIIKISSKIILLKNGKSIPIRDLNDLVTYNYLLDI